MRWLDGIIDSMDMSLSKHWEIVKGREDEVAVPNSASRCHCRVVTESAPTKSQVRSFRFPWMDLLPAWLASVRSKTCASYLLETVVWPPLHFRYDVQEAISAGSAIPSFHRPPAAAHCLMPQEVTVALQGWFNGI